MSTLRDDELRIEREIDAPSGSCSSFGSARST